MKNTYKILLTFLLLPFMACDGFLDEVPPSFISGSNFFQTETDARTAADGIYRSFANGTQHSMYGRWWPAIDLGTDDVASKTTRNNFAAWFDHTITGGHPWLNSWEQYNSFWVGVGRANTVIENVPNIEMDEVAKNAIIGEARALRALSYFHLVKTYGDLPKVVNEIGDKADFNLPRSPAEEIYNEIIIPDLQFAEEHCKDALHDGRVTKWTAKVILADVYMTRAGWRRTSQGEFVQGAANNWTLARDKAKEIIDNSPNALINEPLVNGQHVTPACGVAWNEEMAFSKESLMELGGINVNGFGSYLTRESFTNNTGQKFWGSSGNSKPLESEGINLTITQMRFPQTVGSGLYTPTTDLYRAFEEGDERRDWGLMSRYTTADGATYLIQPSFRKYIDIGFALGLPNTSFRNTNNNFLLYRYADALLIYAEAANEVAAASNGDAAYAAVNEIRNRAGLADLSTGLSQDAFRKAVWKERRLEFHGECKRRFDLIRTNRLKTETENIEIDWRPEDNNGLSADYIHTHPSFGTVSFPDHEWLMPLPTPELRLNEAAGWVQNKGYLD